MFEDKTLTCLLLLSKHLLYVFEGPVSNDSVDSSKLQLVYQYCADMCSYAGTVGIKAYHC